MEVRKALLRSSRPGTFLSTFEIQRKNAPSAQLVYNNLNNALTHAHNEPTTLNQAILYFTVFPNRRVQITSAYNRLPQLHRELNAIAPKIIAARRIQKHWIKARQGVRNKRRVSALLAMKKSGSLPNTTRKIMNIAFSRPVYGPMTEVNAYRSRRKYSTY